MISLLLLTLTTPVVFADVFWITTEIRRVDWEQRCVDFCAKPGYQIEELILPSLNTITHRWQGQEKVHTTVSQWEVGRPEDVALSFSVYGIDPLTSAPRRCGETEAQRLFPREDRLMMTRARRHEYIHPSNNNQRLITLRGNCFNATIQVTKHTERCPNCPDIQEIQKLKDQTTVFASFVTQVEYREKLILLVAAVSMFVALICFLSLVCFLCKSRKTPTIPQPYYYLPYNGDHVKRIPATASCKYDVPWENTTATTTIIRHQDNQSTIYEEISPNCSLGTQDSGLEV